MTTLLFMIFTTVSLNCSASSLKFFVGEEVRKSRVGDKQYSLKVRLSQEEGVFEEFKLIVDNKMTPVTDSRFFN